MIGRKIEQELLQDHVARCYEDENSNNEAIKHKDLG